MPQLFKAASALQWLRAPMGKSRARARMIVNRFEGYAVTEGSARALKLAKEYLEATERFYE